MLRNFLLQEFYEFWLQKCEDVGNLQADDLRKRRVLLEGCFEPLPLIFVHDEDDLGPVEHVGIDAHECVGSRARGSHVKIRSLGEHAFRRGAAHPILPAHEQHAPRFPIRHTSIGIILTDEGGWGDERVLLQIGWNERPPPEPRRALTTVK